MGLSYFAINSTDKTFSIKDYFDPTQTIGKLYPKEFCIRNYEDASYLAFLSTDGTIKPGLIYDSDIKYTQISNLPYSREYIEGAEYLIYEMRRTMNVYYANGDKWGSVAAGMYVATDSCTPGDDHPDWMKIKYVKRTDGEWIKVNGNGYEHGFVDTGFKIASGHDSIPLHGNW